MFFVTGDRYLLGGALFLVANIAFGAAIVVYNSFLPQLAGPDERDARLQPRLGAGYLGGGLLLVLNLSLVAARRGARQTTGDAGPAAGLGRACGGRVFTAGPAARLRDRPPRPRLARGSTCSPTGSGSSAAPCGSMQAYPLTLFFLLAFLVYNDGIQTVITLASQYGTEELRLEQTTLIITILLVQFLAFGGALGWAGWPRASAPGRPCCSAWCSGPGAGHRRATSCRTARRCRS